MNWLTKLLRPAPVLVKVAPPGRWLERDVNAMRDFLESETGRKFCALARHRHLDQASQAVQSGEPRDLARAAGSVDTLRLLLATSNLRELPDLAPGLSDAESSNDDAESATPSLHSLTQT